MKHGNSPKKAVDKVCHLELVGPAMILMNDSLLRAGDQRRSTSGKPAAHWMSPRFIDACFRSSSLPGPSPKRARHSSDEPSIMAPPKVKKSSHVRATSSVSLLKQVAQQVEDLPPVNKKPESISAPVRKPKSKACVSLRSFLVS